MVDNCLEGNVRLGGRREELLPESDGDRHRNFELSPIILGDQSGRGRRFI